MEYYILLLIVLSLISYYGYKIWKLYQPKKTLQCIEVSELQKEIDENKKVQLIDVRSKDEFIEFHLTNAANIPLDELHKGIKQFDKKTKIVIVCFKGAERSQKGAILASKIGYEATWLCGGINEWSRIKA